MFPKMNYRFYYCNLFTGLLISEMFTFDWSAPYVDDKQEMTIQYLMEKFNVPSLYVKEHIPETDITITHRIPQYQLKKGTQYTVVEYYSNPNELDNLKKTENRLRRTESKLKNIKAPKLSMELNNIQTTFASIQETIQKKTILEEIIKAQETHVQLLELMNNKLYLPLLSINSKLSEKIKTMLFGDFESLFSIAKELGYLKDARNLNNYNLGFLFNSFYNDKRYNNYIF